MPISGMPLSGQASSGPRADRDVERTGGERLLHPRPAAEIDRLHVEAVLLEDAGLDADIDRRELEGRGLRLADPDLGCACAPAGRRRRQREGGEQVDASSKYVHSIHRRPSGPVRECRILERFAPAP